MNIILNTHITITYRLKEWKNKYHKLTIKIDEYKKIINELYYNDIVYLYIKSHNIDNKNIILQYLSDIILYLPEKLEGLKLTGFNFPEFSFVDNYIPPSIQYVNCSGNELLNTLPFKSNQSEPEYQLKTLNISNCNISILSNLPIGLKKLICKYNRIEDLSCLQMHNSLEYLDCSANIGITKLTKLPPNLQVINCSHTSVYDGFSLRFLKYLKIFISKNTNFTVCDSYCIDIEHIDLSHNKLSYFGTFNLYRLYKLKYLDVSHNQLTQIVLSNSIRILKCKYNFLDRIGLYGGGNHLRNLYYIDCSYNQLRKLFVLYDKIKFINCNHNRIKKLPLISKTVEELHCSHNMINKFPLIEMPSCIARIDIRSNNIKKLPNILLQYPCLNNNNCDRKLNTYCNPVYKEIFSRKYDIYKDMVIKDGIVNSESCSKDGDCLIHIYFKHKYIRKIETWFLDCKYNPKYLYCRKRLMKEYDELYN
jgi:hypothetical protein